MNITGWTSSTELVVEFAVSSPGLDRESATMYAEAGVKEYWIVLASERRLEIYTHLTNGKYQQKQIVGAGDAIGCTSIPAIRFDVTSLFD